VLEIHTRVTHDGALLHSELLINSKPVTLITKSILLSLREHQKPMQCLLPRQTRQSHACRMEPWSGHINPNMGSCVWKHWSGDNDSNQFRCHHLASGTSWAQTQWSCRSRRPHCQASRAHGDKIRTENTTQNYYPSIDESTEVEITALSHASAQSGSPDLLADRLT